MKHSADFCPSCGRVTNHIDTWTDEMWSHLLPPLPLSQSAEKFASSAIDTLLVGTGIARFREDFIESDIEPRTWCFIEEMRKRGATASVMHTPAGFTNHIALHVEGKTVRFEMLPIAEFANGRNARLADDKKKTKLFLKKNGFPVAEGKTFWFWQNREAITFGRSIGFPLVVKPRNGSVSRHVTTNIQTETELKNAIAYATLYSPSFIVEKFIVGGMYRMTVIDLKFSACVEQLPAHVTGNGTATIRALIDTKNTDPRRGTLAAAHSTTHLLVENEVTKKLFAEKGYTEKTILKKGEIFHLQRDPFLKWGGDLKEVTPLVHPDNVKLSEDIARTFDIRVVGIDVIMPDIRVSWKNQLCAILELNSAPGIDLHHFPTEGAPTNPAKEMADMFFKYYLN